MRRNTILNSAITAIALGVTAAMTVNLKDEGITFRSNPSVHGSAPSTEDAWHGRGNLDDSSYGRDDYSYDGYDYSSDYGDASEHEPGAPPGLEWGHQQRQEPGLKRR